MHKAKEKDLFTNYRIISKIPNENNSERVVYKRMYKLLTYYKLL